MKRARSLFLLALCGVFFFAIALGSSADSSTSSDSGGTSSSKNELKTYALNEDIFVSNSTGKYRIKFTGIKETKERNQFEEPADRVVVLSWEYENLSIEDDLLVSDLNFKLYDNDNNILDTYAISTKFGDSVGKGRKASASEAYALNNASNHIELEFYDNMFNSSPTCKVNLEW